MVEAIATRLRQASLTPERLRSPILRELLNLPIQRLAELFERLSDDDLVELRYSWEVWGRVNQQPPSGDWRVWLLLAGRGFGKTRTLTEWVRTMVESGRARSVALVAPTAHAARAVLVEDPTSGILAVSRPDWMPTWQPALKRVTWPNGAIATTFSADEPDRLRGPQHDAAVADELATWPYPAAWHNLMIGLRLGEARCVVATTPRAIPIVLDLVRPDGTPARPGVCVTRGSTYDNVAHLAPDALAEFRRQYEGTTIGRQELHAEILTSVPGALWTPQLFDGARLRMDSPTREEIERRQIHRPGREDVTLTRVVLAVDPAMSSGGDETGIVVAGVGDDGHGYVLADLSGRGSPESWARRAVAAYHEWHADCLLAEVNQGGDIVQHTVRTVDPSVHFRAVRAGSAKQSRAEPIAALYEQTRVHHVGVYPALEHQCCTWVPGQGRSPDRLDALVWALTDLLVTPRVTAPPQRLPAYLSWMRI
jgi:phage terminase large subunit-like protein